MPPSFTARMELMASPHEPWTLLFRRGDTNRTHPVFDYLVGIRQEGIVEGPKGPTMLVSRLWPRCLVWDDL